MGLSHSPRIVTDGLILCLDAANKRSYPGAGTTWTDLTANKNNGTLTNGPTFDSANGGSIVFDGNDDYVGLGTSIQNAIISTQSYSIVTWIYPTVDPSDSGFIANYNGNAAKSSRNGVALRRLSNGRIRNIINDSGDGNYIAIDSASNSCPVNTWSHVVCTWNGGSTSSSLDIYINSQSSIGNSLDAGSFNDLKSSALEMRIGRVQFLSSSPHFTGNVSLVQIYNKVLSEQEIKQNYLATKGRYA